MRKKIVAGNWKMNTTLESGVKLANEVVKLVAEKGDKNVEVILGAPFTHLTEVQKVVAGSPVKVSAQNCAAEAKGAYTGEVSAEMLRSIGLEYVILGHSERRSYYHDDNHILNKKVKLALANDLKPIFCCGEVLAEREGNIHFNVVKTQVEEGLFDLSEDDFSKIVIAYEPVWAIGTGLVASPAQAQEMHHFIRKTIADKYGKEVAELTTILYGGSCKASNAKELFANHDVDGGLIGGAALVAEEFLGIVNGFQK
jgi:triosephosphate isomerase (TIM)